MHFRRSSEDDEELLLTQPRPVHSRTARHQKSPGCGVFCNTKCGSYFITALQMAFGIAVMLSAVYSVGPKVMPGESESEAKSGYFTYRECWKLGSASLCLVL